MNNTFNYMKLQRLVFYMFYILISTSGSQSTLSESFSTGSNNESVFVEASWDFVGHANEEAAVQSGESISFVCRIWQTIGNSPKPTESPGPSQSVFLYCPLSVAYCAQDCLAVDQKWRMDCTRQYRTYQPHQIPRVKSKLLKDRVWKLQEVIYTIALVTMNANGFWSCSFAGMESEKLKLTVRDRPVVLSFTSQPPSPVVAGTPVNLTCEAAPSPNAPWYHFIWRRLGSRTPPAYATIRISDRVSVLTLLTTRPSDDGRFSCRVVQDLDQIGRDEDSDVEQEEQAAREIHKSNTVIEQGRISPAMMYLDLEVFHAPEQLTFEILPNEPYLPDQLVELICHIHGGKPIPMIHFYRGSMDSNDGQSELFNSSHVQKSIVILNGTARLKWVVRESDHLIQFGCVASGVMLTTQMASAKMELTVIFPPGPPILTATPQTAVSENRTQMYTCRSSKGSNPRGKIHWRLMPTVDYITSSISTNITQTTNGSALERILTLADSIHLFQPGEIPDFDANPVGFEGNHAGLDPSNRGEIAYSEARLVGRTWFNGARITCFIDWKSPLAEKNETGLAVMPFRKPTYNVVEILFAPSAVSMSVIPRSGVQEFVGHQKLECSTTSAVPAPKIKWFRRVAKFAGILGEQISMEDPLELRNEDMPVEDGVEVETLPGLYGGQRVISRLKLSNLSRSEDGTRYICSVSHVEWIKNVGRIHRLVVLYPPRLRIKVDTSKKPNTESRTSLECIPKGGRPAFPIHFHGEFSSIPRGGGQSSSSKHVLQNTSQTFVESGRLWEFMWSFEASYPDELSSPKTGFKSTQANEPSRTKTPNHYSTLFIREPGRTSSGKYTCLLDGPGGRVNATAEVKFPFPPELVPPGITVFTAPEGLHAVIELQVWAYPYPKLLVNTTDHPHSEACFKPLEFFKSPHGSDTPLNVSWYKRDMSKDERLPIPANDQRIWSDVRLIDLYRQSERNVTKSSRSVPTLVFRLGFMFTKRDDYGDYECSIDHVAGNRTFRVRLQAPVDAPRMHLTRIGSVIHLSFDPKLLHADSNSMDVGSNTSSVNNAVGMKHVLLRLCALQSSSNQAVDVFGKSCGPRKSPPTQPDASRCADWLLSEPESGFAVIHLSDPPKNVQPSAAKTSIYSMDPPQRDMVSENDGLNREENLNINWSNVTKILYHFRVYNLHGSLLHVTEWFYKSMDKSHYAQPIVAKSFSAFTWTILLIGISLVAVTTLIPLLLLMIQRRRAAKSGPANLSSPEFPSANNLIDKSNRFYHADSLINYKPDTLYVTNVSLIDSPVPLLDHIPRCEADHVCKRPGDEDICSPGESLHLLSRMMASDGTPVYVIENHANSKSMQLTECNSRRTSLDDTLSMQLPLRFTYADAEQTPRIDKHFRKHPLSPSFSPLQYHNSRCVNRSPVPKTVVGNGWAPIGTVGSCSLHDSVCLESNHHRCLTPTATPQYISRAYAMRNMDEKRAFINYIPQYTNQFSPIPNRYTVMPSTPKPIQRTLNPSAKHPLSKDVSSTGNTLNGLLTGDLDSSVQANGFVTGATAVCTSKDSVARDGLPSSLSPFDRPVKLAPHEDRRQSPASSYDNTTETCCNLIIDGSQ